MSEYIEITDFWHHINLRRKKLDLPTSSRPVLFAEYDSDLKVFYKFVGHIYIEKGNWLVYPTGRMKQINETKSKLYWSELPEYPEVEYI